MGLVAKEVLGWDEEMYQKGYERLACMRDNKAWPALGKDMSDLKSPFL